MLLFRIVLKEGIAFNAKAINIIKSKSFHK